MSENTEPKFVYGNPGHRAGLIAPTLETMDNYVIHEARPPELEPATLCGIDRAEWAARSDRVRETWKHPDPKYTTCVECLKARDGSAFVTDATKRRKK